MKAEDLKKSILQYAMQGKLVPQDPTDEPASELLKRIKAGKEQLIKDGKIKKEKPLPPITQDEIPYELPQGWEWVRLQTILNSICAGGDKPANFTEIKTARNIYPVIANGEKNDGILGYSDAPTVTEKSITVSGRGTMGFVCIREPNYIPIVRLLVLVPNKNINMCYLKYLLTLLAENGQGTAVKQLTVPMFTPKLVPIPPLSEQKRIVEKIEELMPLVDEYAKNEVRLTEMNTKLSSKLRKSILQHAVQGKLVPQNPADEPASELLKRIKTEKAQLVKDGKIKKEKPMPPISEDEIPYELPQGWEWVKLGDIVNYGSTGNIEYSEITDKNTWVLDLEDIEKVSSKLLAKNTLKDKVFDSTKKTFKKGDVLYGKLRPYLDKVLVAEDDGVCTTEILPLRPYGNINSYYLRVTLKTPDFLNYVNQLTYGVKMPRLGTEDGKNALIPLPPLVEQKRIVAEVDELMKICDELEEQIKNTKNINQRIIEQISSAIKQNNVIDITQAINKRAVLEAYVIEKSRNNKHFCAIMGQKLMHLIEKCEELPLEGKYEQAAAGPLDPEARKKIKEIFEKHKWFKVVEGNEKQKEEYIPDIDLKDYEPLFNECFGDKKEGIDRILGLFKDKSLKKCEAVSTLYAVWNDLLIDSEDCSDDNIINRFYEWSKRKQEFKKSDLLDELVWMRRHDIVPAGKGLKTLILEKQIALF